MLADRVRSTVIAAPLGPITDGLQLWLKLDDGSGTAVLDSSDNAVVGTLTNGTWEGTDYKQGTGCIKFTQQADNRISVPHNANHTGMADLTITCWTKPIGWGQGSWGRILSKRGTSLSTLSYELHVSNVSGSASAIQSCSASIGSGAGSSEDDVQICIRPAYTITLNQWVHLTVRSSNQMVEIVQDANFAGSTVVSKSRGGVYANTSAAFVGLRSGDNQREYNGLIDDLRVYNRLLSDEEISSVYNGTG